MRVHGSTRDFLCVPSIVLQPDPRSEDAAAVSSLASSALLLAFPNLGRGSAAAAASPRGGRKGRQLPHVASRSRLRHRLTRRPGLAFAGVCVDVDGSEVGTIRRALWHGGEPTASSAGVDPAWLRSGTATVVGDVASCDDAASATATGFQPQLQLHTAQDMRVHAVRTASRERSVVQRLADAGVTGLAVSARRAPRRSAAACRTCRGWVGG